MRVALRKLLRTVGCYELLKLEVLRRENTVPDARPGKRKIYVNREDNTLR